MNCRRVEELLPLYAGGDIDSRLTGQVQTHLGNCGGCAELAADFEASSKWLAGATPELDQAMLADMKRGVMLELQTAKPRSGWFEILSGTVAGTLLRPAVAASLLLLLFGALTLWVFVGKKASTPTEAKGRPDQVVSPDQVATAPDDAPRVTPKERSPGQDRHPGVVPRRRSGTLGRRQVITQVANSPHEAEPPSLRPVDSGRMLRIEIQTGDPSIRIIWFAPEEVDSQQTNP